MHPWLAGVLWVWLLVQAGGQTTAGARGGDEKLQQEFLRRLVAAAVERTQHVVRYDPGYVALAYPGGDVPADSGVCTDEIIRSYRAVGVDLQKEVHEDMARNFSVYQPDLQQKRPDANIDHRRVINLMKFFARKGEALPVTRRPQDYSPGDIVTWNLTADRGGDRPHIGIVVDKKSPSGRYMIVHNIGEGPKMEDVLFDWKITGHYRYVGARPAAAALPGVPTLSGAPAVDKKGPTSGPIQVS